MRQQLDVDDLKAIKVVSSVEMRSTTAKEERTDRKQQWVSPICKQHWVGTICKQQWVGTVCKQQWVGTI